MKDFLARRMSFSLGCTGTADRKKEDVEQLLRMRERDDALLASAGESSHH
jgi:hypothetical protein